VSSSSIVSGITGPPDLQTFRHYDLAKHRTGLALEEIRWFFRRHEETESLENLDVSGFTYGVKNHIGTATGSTDCFKLSNERSSHTLALKLWVNTETEEEEMAVVQVVLNHADNPLLMNGNQAT
jgi:hypothetical protein